MSVEMLEARLKGEQSAYQALAEQYAILLKAYTVKEEDVKAARDWLGREFARSRGLQYALRECARRIANYYRAHSQTEECAVMGMAVKMLREVIEPALELKGSEATTAEPTRPAVCAHCNRSHLDPAFNLTEDEAKPMRPAESGEK